MDLDTFAAQRDRELLDLAALYRPAVEEALQEEDESARTELLLAALAAAFVLVYGEEGGVDATASSYSAAFQNDMRASIERLVPDESDAQTDRLTNWFATATFGAASVAAADSLPGVTPTKTWVTMRDEAVRDIHAQLDGETKSLTETFTVKSDPFVEMEYPGQPVGPIEAWINCRCVLLLDTEPILAAGERQNSTANGTVLPASGFSGVIIAALPEGDGTVMYADGNTTELHQTIVYLGTTDQLAEGEREAIVALTQSLAESMVPFTARVAGMGQLGEHGDTVAITEAAELQALHDAAVADATVGQMFASRNEHPTWISHVTNDGYSIGDEITFDRLGAWFGEDHQTFELGAPPVEDEIMEDPDTPPVPAEPIAAEDENMPVYGVAVPEGVESGDYRRFAPGALTHRPLPLPLTWQRASANEHDGEVVVGRVDTLELRDDGMWHYAGELFMDVPETEEVISLIAQRGLRGVSIAGDKGKLTQPTEEEMLNALETGVQPTEVWEEARISGLTIVQIPAFAESFIALGYEEAVAASGEVETYKRGSGWITHPEETNRLHDYWTKGKGAAKIRWGTNGDFTRCTRQLNKYIEPRFLNRTCAQWHHDALGYWPGELGKPGNPPDTPENRRRAARHAEANASLDNCTTPECEDLSMIAASAAPEFTLTAAAPPPMVERILFNDPKFTGPTPLSVTAAGGVRHLRGHIATWDVCHIGIDRQCVTAPKSRTNYAHYHLGSILTTEGELPVGALTLGTGHADLNLSVNDTRNHYDHTGTMVASVRAGEDDYGIWVSGVVCDGVTDEQVRTLMASGGISGDWRSIGGNLELVAALAVNVPGFPVPRPSLAASAGRTNALVAAGVVVNDPDNSIDLIASAVVEKLAAREQRAAKLAALRDVQTEARTKRVNDLVGSSS